MFDTYIFDLDGTLLDTIEDLAIAVNYSLEKNNYPLRTLEEVSSFVGNGVFKLMERAIGVKNADVAKPLDDFLAYYREHSAVKTKPYDGIIEVLQELKKCGKKTAIVSNKIDCATKDLAKIYFDGLIDVALGENEAGGIRKKPARDSIDLALKELNADPSSAVYIGDSEVDIQTAKNAGMTCISVTWGLREENFLKESGGEIFARSPKELLNF
jgi:phosphoglycolate phosphatase